MSSIVSKTRRMARSRYEGLASVNGTLYGTTQYGGAMATGRF